MYVPVRPHEKGHDHSHALVERVRDWIGQGGHEDEGEDGDDEENHHKPEVDSRRAPPHNQLVGT